MGVKKIARPINKAKNKFIKWLNENGAGYIDVFEGRDELNEWDYYRNVTTFIGESFFYARFAMWRGETNISYREAGTQYENMSVDEFLKLIDKPAQSAKD